MRTFFYFSPEHQDCWTVHWKCPIENYCFSEHRDCWRVQPFHLNWASLAVASSPGGDKDDHYDDCNDCDDDLGDDDDLNEMSKVDYTQFSLRLLL